MYPVAPLEATAYQYRYPAFCGAERMKGEMISSFLWPYLSSVRRTGHGLYPASAPDICPSPLVAEHSTTRSPMECMAAPLRLH